MGIIIGLVALYIYISDEKPILKEFHEIESKPSNDFKCGRLDGNIYEWQFAVRGATGTEFEGGIYHGWIQFPEDYPSKPPSFMFLTENGSFKIKTKIGLKWLPSWRVRDGLLALIDLMSTNPHGELGSVESNMKERRDLAIISRTAVPRCFNSERHKVIDVIHEYMLSEAPPVPVPGPPQLSPPVPSHEHSQNDGGCCSYINSDENIFIATNSNGLGIWDSMNEFSNEGTVVGNIFNATNSNGVGILDSMNEFSNEGPKPKKAKHICEDDQE